MGKPYSRVGEGTIAFEHPTNEAARGGKLPPGELAEIRPERFDEPGDFEHRDRKQNGVSLTAAREW